ncbi:transcriptional regulator, TetR family [Rhizobium sp. PDO1-076]|uniref:TetR/AcrR family transcriptional regulator n=1 Tax=Rhizobium sp. PDO1-076 TaxID=1125979 RepID=UPI00024E2435|nr:TetR/AcrR family transcriptional regulator [Rhizobium sp. PDO1-076]EHS49963.1 transcriptional regulator, TetR family [Rhizobium sp. PDO1-076]
MTEPTTKPNETKEQPPAAAPGLSRFAAGEDPIKRGQILDGAKRVFMKMGYDAASMNDVTREAGVSKGTIYVYFQSKEELFAALIEREKGRFAERMRELLEQSTSAEDGLRRFGLAFAHQVINTDMIPSMRVVLGVIDRMPSLCQRFFAGAPTNAKTVLRAFLQHHAESGQLHIDDCELAARQFIDLAVGSYFRERLFNQLPTDITQAEIERVVDSGLKLFLGAYGPPGPENT